jgi:outer membrane protein, adhesin transport system
MIIEEKTMCDNHGGVRKIVGALGVVTLLFSSSVSAQSLKSVVQTALNTYPEIQEARHLRQAIENDLGVAKSRYLPTLDVEVSYGREYSDNGTVRGRGDDSIHLDRKETGWKLREIIFDGFEREGTVEEQKARLRGALQHIGDRGEVIAADVSFSYIDVLRHQQILKLANDNLKVHRKILDDVKKRVDGGQLGVGDLQQARSRLSSAQARITEVKSDLDKARISFNRIVGRMPDHLSRPGFNDSRLPPNVRAAVDTAMQNNPLIKRFQAELDASKALIRVAKSGKYPHLFLELGGTHNDNIDGTIGTDTDWTAMLKMQWNLYRGGADNARTKAAAARHSESMSKLALARRDIEREVRRAWADMKRKDEEAESRSAQVKSNQEVTETYKEEFKVGQRDLLDVLDAENELFSSKTKHISARHSALYARYLLTATTGKLRQLLGVQTNIETAANE